MVKQVQHVVGLAGGGALSLLSERLIAVPHSDHVATSSLKDCRMIYCTVSFQNCSAAKPIQGDEVTLTELYSFISSFILPFFFIFLTADRGVFLDGKKREKNWNNT